MITSAQPASENPLHSFDGLKLDDTLLTGKESTVADFKRLMEALKVKFGKTNRSSSLEKTPLLFSQGSSTKCKTPIVFLDFDGVCWVSDVEVAHERYRALKGNQELQKLFNEHLQMLHTHCGFEDVDEFVKFVCFDYANMQRIKSLCKEFNARIVVTSNWRKRRSITHLANMLDMWGLGHYVTDKTSDAGSLRSIQIKEWQNLNAQSGNSFVVLDDMYEQELTSHFKEKFILCDFKKAFDHNAYLRAHCCLQTQSVLANKTKTLVEATEQQEALHTAIPSG